MNAIKLIAACAVLAGAGAAFAQNSGPAQPQNVLQLSANGTVEVQQDLLNMTLVTTREETGPVTGYLFDVHLQGERETVFLTYPRHGA